MAPKKYLPGSQATNTTDEDLKLISSSSSSSDNSDTAMDEDEDEDEKFDEMDDWRIWKSCFKDCVTVLVGEDFAGSKEYEGISLPVRFSVPKVLLDETLRLDIPVDDGGPIHLKSTFPESFAWVLERAVANPRKIADKHRTGSNKKSFKLFVGVCILAYEHTSTADLFKVGIQRLFEIREQNPKVSECLRENSCFLLMLIWLCADDGIGHRLRDFALYCLVLDYLRGNTTILGEITSAVCKANKAYQPHEVSEIFCDFLTDLFQSDRVSPIPKFPKLEDRFFDDWD